MDSFASCLETASDATDDVTAAWNTSAAAAAIDAARSGALFSAVAERGRLLSVMQRRGL